MYLIIRVAFVAALGALAIAASASNAPALNAGDLDPSFGSGGLASLQAPPDYGYATFDTAVQPDGKILTAGYEQFMSGYTAIAVQRFNADGSLDLTFGGGDGVAVAQPAVSNSSMAFSVKVATDGSIFLGGYRVVTSSPNPYTSEFVVVKFTPTGILDTTFDGDAQNSCGPSNGNGVVCTRVSSALGQDSGQSLVIDGDGNVVLVGSAYLPPTGPVMMGALRLTSTGARDASFSTDGRVTVSAGVAQSGFNSSATSAALDPSSGKIVMAGQAQGEGPNFNGDNQYVNAFGLVRLNNDGGADSGFHYTQPDFTGPPTTDGVVLSSRTAWTYGSAYDVAVQPDGKVVAVGYANEKYPSVSPFPSSGAILRLSSDGSPDASFGTGGRKYLDLGVHNSADEILSDSAGRLYVSGYFEPGLVKFEYAARLSDSGALDPTFSGTGWRKIDWGADVNAGPSGMAFTPDSKLLVSGGGAGTPRSAFARLITASDPVNPIPLEPVVAKITSPKSKSLKAKNLHVLSGTAGPEGSVKSVQIALQRINTKALKKKKRCYWLRSKKANFKSVRATKGKCSKPYYRTASGTNSWKYRITRTLPKGRYVLTVRVTLLDGRSGLFTKKFKLK